MMTTDACATWSELADREALGEGLSPLDTALLRAHEAACPACAAEAAAFRSLNSGVLEAVPNDEQIEAIIRAAAMAPSTTVAPVRRRWLPSRSIVGVAAACLAAAAAALVVVRAGEPAGPSAQPAPVAHAPLPAALPREAEGASAPAHGAEALWTASSAPSCRVVLGDVTLCLDSGSEARTDRLTGTSAVLELLRGRAVASLARRPPGSSFAIETAAGSVRAVGTIFSVEVEAGGATIARVVRGEVAVQARDVPEPQRLLAGQALRVGAAGEVVPIGAEARKRDLALLPASAATGEASESSRPSSVDALARARLLRARGESAQAAEIYQAAYAASPRSSSGRAALLALAELRLSDLGDAAGALRAFDTYLASSGGSLAREAEYGRIRALRALGRRPQEALAIERFLRAYPDGPEAQPLRQRLEAIRGR